MIKKIISLFLSATLAVPIISSITASAGKGGLIGTPNENWVNKTGKCAERFLIGEESENPALPKTEDSWNKLFIATTLKVTVQGNYFGSEGWNASGSIVINQKQENWQQLNWAIGPEANEDNNEVNKIYVDENKYTLEVNIFDYGMSNNLFESEQEFARNGGDLSGDFACIAVQSFNEKESDTWDILGFELLDKDGQVILQEDEVADGKVIFQNGEYVCGDWEIVNDATCTQEGLKKREGPFGLEEAVIPKLDHSYGSWKTTKTATCTAAGTQERKCSLCGKVETKTIPAKGHSYKAATVKSTYFAKGYTAKKCSTCRAVTGKKETVMLTMAAPKSTSSASSVKLSWSKVSGAKGYVVYQKKSGKWSRIKVTSSNSYTVSKLKSGTTYQFCIKPYKTSGSKTVYGNTSKTLTTSTNPATVSFKLTAGSKKATVKWSKVTGASGYKIYYKTSKNGSWKSLKTVNNKTTSYTKTGLTKGKTYYFTVKAYRTTGGKTYNGGYAAKSVKIK